ncbi:hypothetical protein CC80DRAFT_542510 [Byssothecium circinans]|uniref:Uncharacterized protein n=1 Tax=Byssothecium circinans TaxID=147558 RepID=A0A6A5UM83_9PLEO|nr:hypothetical protein CC80DRAFT_542510 [Byssothecium circinans]
METRLAVPGIDSHRSDFAVESGERLMVLELSDFSMPTLEPQQMQCRRVALHVWRRLVNLLAGEYQAQHHMIQSQPQSKYRHGWGKRICGQKKLLSCIVLVEFRDMLTVTQTSWLATTHPATHNHGQRTTLDHHGGNIAWRHLLVNKSWCVRCGYVLSSVTDPLIIHSQLDHRRFFPSAVHRAGDNSSMTPRISGSQSNVAANLQRGRESRADSVLYAPMLPARVKDVPPPRLHGVDRLLKLP